MRRKTKADPRFQTAQDFINVEDITDDLLYSRDGYLFGYLSVRAGDNSLFSDRERAVLAQQLTAAVSSGENKPIQLLSIPRTVDTTGMIEYMVERRKAAKSDGKLRLINGEISSLRELAREGTKEPMIVLKCWEKAAQGADLILEKRLKELRNKLTECQITVEQMSGQEITCFCRQFADLTTYHSGESEVYEDVPLLPAKKRFLTIRSEDGEAAALRNLLTPIGGLSFGISHVTIGTAIGRIYGVVRYPSELEYGWAVEMMNNSDCVTAITYYPGNGGEMADALARSIRQSAGDVVGEGNARRRKHFEKQAIDANKLIEEIDFKSAPVGQISILAMPFSNDEESLEDICRSVCSRFAAKRMKLRALGNVQKEAYRHLSPYYPNQPVIDEMLQRICPLETLMGGFPMTVNLYRDDRGCYFARTMDGGVMSLNLFYRGRDRTNSNFVFTGKPGMGKSTTVKHLAITEYMNGAKILVIDPEREFRDTCKKQEGGWLDVGGGSVKINPLHVRPVPEDEEDDPAYQGETNALALHIQMLDVIFKLRLPSLDDYQRALLRQAVEAVYREHGIEWDTDVSRLSAEDFPIMEDLYGYLQRQEDADHKRLAVLLYDMALGAESFLWNGHTNADISNDFLVFDTFQLQNAPDEVKKAQYFNVLGYCWQVMSENRSQPVILICDEGYILLDPEMPQTSMYLRNYAKRARKYESAVWLVVHSLVDLLNERVKLPGQAILDAAAYKVFFGADGKNLEETSELFHLTEAEQDILQAQIRGRALMLLGNQHIHVDFDIPQYKLNEMGTAGGR